MWDVAPVELSSRWGNRSKAKLRQVDPRLQHVIDRVVNQFNMTALTGHRNKEDQNEAFEKGTSQLRWPKGKHNKMPSEAIDVAPWPIDWKDEVRYYRMGQLVMTRAHEMGIPLRWGGSWKNNGIADGWDPGHFEMADVMGVIPHVNRLSL